MIEGIEMKHPTSSTTAMAAEYVICNLYVEMRTPVITEGASAVQLCASVPNDGYAKYLNHIND